MCGRYTLYSDSEIIQGVFGTSQLSFPIENYNVAPTSIQPVICELPGGNKTICMMRWNLIPAWQKDNKKSSVLINARVETIHEKPSFRNAIKDRRCLVIADGYFEWKEENGIKQPYYISLKSNLPFAFAGIWERNVTKAPMDSFAIITVPANDTLRAFHDRMPAILQQNDYALWLNTDEREWNHLKCLLESYPAGDLQIYPVSTKVNNTRYNAADTVVPLIKKS